MQGRLVSVCGVDGAGKSSHLIWLRDFLEEQGVDVVLTREPGGTPLGEKLREMMLHEKMDPRTETLLMHAARIEHIEQVIKPAMESGSWVITDRFSDSSFAYQAFGRYVGVNAVEWLERFSCGDLEPNLTFLFDLDPTIAKERREASRDTLDRFETEQSDFFERTRDGYLWRAGKHPHRFVILDGSKSIEQIRQDISPHLQAQINDWLLKTGCSQVDRMVARS